MTLEVVFVELGHEVIPSGICEFLAQAEQQVGEFTFSRQMHVPGFIPCCFETVYQALRQISLGQFAKGNMFCEWGSGYGVVTSLAALMGFNALGIEIDPGLSDASRSLASQFDIPARFVTGSFIPENSDEIIADARAEMGGELTLVTRSLRTCNEMGIDAGDFDLIFAYPWPNDQNLTEKLFDTFASKGSLLLTYNGAGMVHLQRKV